MIKGLYIHHVLPLALLKLNLTITTLFLNLLFFFQSDDEIFLHFSPVHLTYRFTNTINTRIAKLSLECTNLQSNLNPVAPSKIPSFPFQIL